MGENDRTPDVNNIALDLIQVLILLASILLVPFLVNGQSGPAEAKRAITVADAIGMVRLAEPDRFISGSSQRRVASFSPDRKKFVVVLRKGDLNRNANEFSLLLFQTGDVASYSKPDLLVVMSSSSNRSGIRELKWLADNQTIAFLGENLGEPSQVYTFDLRTRHLRKLTNHATAVTSYDTTPDGGKVIFVADPPPKKVMESEEAKREGIVIGSQELPDILAGDSAKTWRSEIFVQKAGQPPMLIPVEDSIYEGSPLSLSPTGEYALVGGRLLDIPTIWADYQANPLHELVVSSRRKGQATPLQRYLLVDTKDCLVTPLLNTPMLGLNPIIWAPDGKEVLIENTYLPLDVTDPVEREERTKKPYDVGVTLSSKEYRKIPNEVWPKQKGPSPEMEVTLQEDENKPPKIYVFDSRTKKNTLLLDLNPRFGELNFGRVETIEWTVEGIKLIGGLYLPPDYAAGKRYPLVIQTHGFVPKQFSMDGRSEWSSGFAARPLAASGIIVLQAYAFKDRLDHDRVANDRRFGATERQSFRNFNALVFERAIDYLDTQGIIDRERVGIVGFSRTVCFVAYTLTHSQYKFAAASLVDGIDCGYFQYISSPHLSVDFDELNGGVAPFGAGLERWLKESPSFNLDKVHSPVRLVALDPPSVLEMWEWYAGLTLQNKPVELIEIADGTHLLEKPWDRRIAMQGMVDWFRFWLKGEEDSLPEKRSQYSRWRELRNQ